jgi:lysophospholipase L1-like esterase
MKRQITLALVLWLLVPSLARAADDLPLVAAAECRVRDGLPNFMAKARQGGDVRVAYIGGSITAANGWRGQTSQWLQSQWPNSRIIETDAAIGGTGSDLGVFRFRHDVLEHKPDLVFIEFAVNDGGAAPEQIYRCMEGMVRQGWKQDPAIDICFVYTLVEGMVPTLAEGKFPRSASAMEKVADHYGIPSIHMGLEVVRLATAGQMIMKANPKTDAEKAALAGKMIFSGDGVHPRADTGHKLYTEAIARSFEKIKPAGKVGPHNLVAPLVADNYENAKMIPVSAATLSPGWKKLDATDPLAKRFAKYLPEMYVAKAAGETLSLKFKGVYAGFYDLLGPDCGQLQAGVDGKTVTILRFDPYCTYHRMGSFAAGRGLPDGEHTVQVTVDGTMPDKAAILAKRNEKIDDPKRFAEHNWYVGWIMLIGDAVPIKPAGAN